MQIVLVLAVSCAVAHKFTKVNLFENPSTLVYLEQRDGNGLNLMLKKGGVSELLGKIGRKTGKFMKINRLSDNRNVTSIEFENNQTLTLSSQPVGKYAELQVKSIGMVAHNKNINIGLLRNWNLESIHISPRKLTTENSSTSGEFFYFEKTVPLFVDQNELEKNMVCFIAEVKPPYSTKRNFNELKYMLLIADNAKTAHEYAVQNYLGKPVGYPDERMISHSIWSTWARYKRDVNHSVVIDFANEIIDNEFKNSQYEIDDLWEICYGALTVDKNKFPDFAATNRQLKQMGFRVTVWVHPFINKGCEPWYTEALTKGYLVTIENGTVVTSWWNNNGTTATYVDFTKTAARDWWIERLDMAQKEYEIDSFKFDAEESSWSPEVAVQTGDIREHPAHITREYVKAVAKYGPMVEVRAGQRNVSVEVHEKMGVLKLGATFAILLVSALAYKVQLRHDGLIATLQNNIDSGLDIVIATGDDEYVLGNIGRTLSQVDLVNEVFSNEGTIVEFADKTTLTFSVSVDESRATKLSLNWKAPSTKRLEDCFSFGSKQWYGGPELKEQYWPIQNSHIEEYSYVSKEADNAAVTERYWLNSEGQYFYVAAEVPLFVDHHTIEDQHICFISEVKAPYSTQRTQSELSYDIWFLSDAKAAHQHAVDNYLGKPSGIPDFRMIQHPIWSTWARYSREITEESLLEYANEIVDNGFDNSQFEIDDLWEICYGSLTVNEDKFPDFKKTVQDIKSLGFRVTIWAHPFINKGCDPWYSEALEKGYFVVTEDGSVDSAWWNDNGTVPAYIDFTNPDAAEWWAARLRELIQTYDIDSIKFDAGETSWSPQIPVQNGPIELHPSNIVVDYVRKCAEFGDMIEIRSGARTQDLPVFIRMVDKDTLWTFENGLPTLVTTLLQMNLNGYTLVLPDMIGGNGYNESPSKELFVRWLQANVFMPTLQYSFVPWQYDDEAVSICKKYTELHASFAEEIASAMRASVSDGTPVNAPIWWLDPTDEVALGVWDEFLLGESILVAPVLEEGAKSRDIYLPTGSWLAEGDSKRSFQGGQWLRDYPAPLDTLPYFTKA